MHVFVDASEVAFSAVCFLRIVMTEDDVNVSFIIGKTRCAPVKFLSIPRLELQAAVLGVRLHNTVKKSHNFKITKSMFWSDSKTVLHWINDDSRKYKTFVANRIGEILDSTSPNQWNWISSSQNVADDATRDKHPFVFECNRRRITGPDWLKMNEADWPHQPSVLEVTDELELQPLKNTILVVQENVFKLSI